MTLANVLYLVMAVSAFTIFGVSLFTAWLVVTVLGGERAAAAPPSEAPTEPTEDAPPLAA